jgi:hypothetical protein
MALYKYPNFLQTSDHQAFDLAYTPGTATPYSGIYRCTGCGLEIAEVRGRPLPPQNHHQHANTLVPIRWQLIVTHVTR